MNHNVPTYENNTCVGIGPRNVGKTYYMLRMLEKKGEKKTNSYNNQIS